jgi:8-oxo-dGTP pyrophosphatase MutT (NUDIX family)
MDLEQVARFLATIRTKLNKYETELFDMASKPGLLRSAVLVPITYINGELKLIYTRRSTDLVRHKGQVSFPGGLIEPGDKSPTDTALRETCEEINICEQQIDLIGCLKPFNSQTGYYIYPVVGFLHDLNGLQRNGTEVDRIFCIPLAWLSDPKNSMLTDYLASDGTTRKVWFYEKYEAEVLWGITAFITKTFLDLILE